METERKRLTLDLEPALHRRLKAISQKKGMSMRRYCNAVLDRELAKDESEGSSEGGINWEAFERLAVLRKKHSTGRTSTTDSVELIREARAIREADTAGWS